MLSLTHKQAELLGFLKHYQEENGVAPSFEEMRQALQVASKSGIHRLIQALEERGRINRKQNRARCIEIIPDREPNALEAFSSVELLAELARRHDANRRTEECSNACLQPIS